MTATTHHPHTGAPPEVVARAREHLRALLQFDTTNPPGNEGPAVEYCQQVLEAAGFETTVVESQGRPNLVTRLQGTGARPPVLVHGHLDVVPADPSRWTHPPFEAVEADGCLWGRGAIDMKNMAATMLAILVGMREQGIQPARDIIFAAVADEEVGCEHGSQFLVDQHADLLNDAEYAIGEGGGFSVDFAGKRIYMVMTAEKGLVWLRMKARGQAGHGSMPIHESAVVKLARAVERVGSVRLPPHGEAVELFIKSLADQLPLHAGVVLRMLLVDRLRDVVLDKLFPNPDLARPMAALLANTCSPTVLRGGTKTNVIPGEALAELDCRTLPGQSTQDLIAELAALAGPEVQFEVIQAAPATQTSPDTAMFRHLCAMLRRHDPDGIPIPSLCPGFTDAKSFSQLGIRCYGFLPLKLPPEIRYADMFHGVDERIPLAAMDFGTRVLWDTLLEA